MGVAPLKNPLDDERVRSWPQAVTHAAYATAEFVADSVEELPIPQPAMLRLGSIQPSVHALCNKGQIVSAWLR